MTVCIPASSVQPNNFNGPIISKVVGIDSTDKCCDACASAAKCVRWVWQPSTNDCNLLSKDGDALIGALGFQSGTVTPGYDAPTIANQWGMSFLVGLAILTALYLFGGMVRSIRARAYALGVCIDQIRPPTGPRVVRAGVPSPAARRSGNRYGAT